MSPCSPVVGDQGLRFRDVTHEVGVYDLNRAWGVSWRDVEWDGRPDLLWVNHDKRRVTLSRNADGVRFETDRGGFFVGGDAHSGMLADVDADGYAELYVVNGYHLEDRFLEQTAPGVYEPATREGLSGDADVRGRSASWSDFDGDGDLDLHVQNLNTPDFLFLQRSDGTFEESADARGVQNTFNKFGAAAADLDSDGDVDLFIPILEPMSSLLLLNRGDGYFVDRTFEFGLEDTRGARAVAVGDYDNDGFVDLYLAGVRHSSGGEFQQGALFHNEEGKGYRDVTGRVIVSPVCPDSRAAGFFDFDNDGWLDLYVACGADNRNRNLPNVLFHNQGGLRFQEVDADACAGAAYPGRTGSFAVADYNLDGLVDVAVANGFGSRPDGGAHVLLRNESTSAGSWIRVFPRGSRGNPDGLGATVTVGLADGSRIVRIAGTQQGMGQNESIVHVGIGNRDRVDDIRVRWPDGRFAHLQGSPAGQLVMPLHGAGRLIHSHPASLLGEVEPFDLDVAVDFIEDRLGHALPPPDRQDLVARQKEVLAWAMARILDQKSPPTDEEITAAWVDLEPQLLRPRLYWMERFALSAIRQSTSIDQEQTANEIAAHLRLGAESLDLARTLDFRSHGPRGANYIRGALDVGWLDDMLIGRIFGEHAETIRDLSPGETWGPQEISDYRDVKKRDSDSIRPWHVVRMGPRAAATPARRDLFDRDIRRYLRRRKLRQSLEGIGALAVTGQIMGSVGFLHGVMYDVEALAAAAAEENIQSSAPVSRALRRVEAEARLDRAIRDLLERSTAQMPVRGRVAERESAWNIEDRLDVVLYRFNSRDLADEAVQQFRAGAGADEVSESLQLFPLTDPGARQLGRFFQELQLTRPLWRRLTGDARFDELLELQDGQVSRVYAGAGHRFFVVWRRAYLGKLRFEAAEARARMELLDEAAQRLIESTLSAGDRTGRDSPD